MRPAWCFLLQQVKNYLGYYLLNLPFFRLCPELCVYAWIYPQRFSQSKDQIQNGLKFNQQFFNFKKDPTSAPAAKSSKIMKYVYGYLHPAHTLHNMYMYIWVYVYIYVCICKDAGALAFFQITKQKRIYKVYGLFFSSVYLLEIIFGLGCYLLPFSSTHSKIYIFLFFWIDTTQSNYYPKFVYSFGERLNRAQETHSLC